MKIKWQYKIRDRNIHGYISDPRHEEPKEHVTTLLSHVFGLPGAKFKYESKL